MFGRLSEHKLKCSAIIRKTKISCLFSSEKRYAPLTLQNLMVARGSLTTNQILISRARKSVQNKYAKAIKTNVRIINVNSLTRLKVPLRRKFCIPFSLQLLKVEVINTYHAKFYIEIPTGRPVILIVKFSFVLPPLLDSKNGREPHRELDLVAPRGI